MDMLKWCDMKEQCIRFFSFWTVVPTLSCSQILLPSVIQDMDTPTSVRLKTVIHDWLLKIIQYLTITIQEMLRQTQKWCPEQYLTWHGFTVDVQLNYRSIFVETCLLTKAKSFNKSKSFFLRSSFLGTSLRGLLYKQKHRLNGCLGLNVGAIQEQFGVSFCWCLGKMLWTSALLNVYLPRTSYYLQHSG